MKDDIYFMHKALLEAFKAQDIDEVPIGAIIVKGGKIIARAHNEREKRNDPTAHAEILAIRSACRKVDSWRLVDCTMYVTVEPCSMCAGTILWARINKVVYGAQDPKGGALGSSYNLFAQKNLNHRPEITGGILEKECASIIREYFKKKREMHE